MKRNRALPVLALLLAAMLPACATVQNNHDPIEPANRVTDKVNDNIDRVTLKPAAQGYTAVVPKPMRTAVSNFYDNATYANTILNDFLQGKGQQGMMDIIRFLINSSLGIGGLVDVASSMGFDQHEEDFGQTLAVWGFSQGAYIIYPLLGPNSVRHTPDFLTATGTDPLFWASFVLAPYITIPVTALKYIDKRARLLEASDMRDELALDPYVFTREAYRQNRLYRIHDGNPPAPKQDNDSWEEDSFDSEDEPKSKAIIKPATPADQLQPQTMPLKVVEPVVISDQTALSSGKQYFIFLSYHYSEGEAVAEQGRLSKVHIHTGIQPVLINKRTWYILRITNPVAAAEAEQQLKHMKKATGHQDAWLERSN